MGIHPEREKIVVADPLCSTGKVLIDTLKVQVGTDGSFAFPAVLPDVYTLRLLPGGKPEGQMITVGFAGLEGLEISAPLQR